MIDRIIKTGYSIVLFFGDKMPSSLNAQQKKTVLIASIAFSALFACYCISYLINKWRSPNLNHILNTGDKEQLLSFLANKGASVKELDLRNFSLENQDIKEIINYCPYLEKLDFSSKGSLSSAQWLEYLKTLVSLKHLNLSGCREIEDWDLEHLKGLTSLKSLNLYECVQITDQGLEHLKDLTSLRKLNLHGCHHITDQGLKHLKNLISLRDLELGKCNITDDGLEYLKDLTSLKYLDLAGCKKITDEGLKHVENLTSLQHLDLLGCDKITDEGLKYLEALVSLTYLNLVGCNHITDFGLKYFKTQAHVSLYRF